jgi:hypothetical protein
MLNKLCADRDQLWICDAKTDKLPVRIHLGEDFMRVNFTEQDEDDWWR